MTAFATPLASLLRPRLARFCGQGSRGSLTRYCPAMPSPEPECCAMPAPDPISFLAPVGSDGSPSEAFATHRARAKGIAKYFAATRPLPHARLPHTRAAGGPAKITGDD